MFQLILSIATLALMLFALIDAITSENWQVQHLPKMLWILIIIILPLVGSIIWLIVGKDRGAAAEHGSVGDPRRWAAQPEPVRGRALSDDAAIEEEIAYHEKQAEIRRLESELRRRREQP